MMNNEQELASGKEKDIQGLCNYTDKGLRHKEELSKL